MYAVPSASITGELKTPLPVAKVQGRASERTGRTALRPLCRASARNFGQGLAGSSGTS
jgi:hypothetical protein